MQFSVVIPALNEEKTVARVVAAARDALPSAEVIVISDGSEDATVREARRAGARVIELPENRGKGAAMAAGVLASKGEILIFLDADLLGLRPQHVQDLVRPLLEKKAGMSLGLFEGGRVHTDLAQIVAPFLSGQRAIRRETLGDLEQLTDARFAAELWLSRNVAAQKLKVRVVPLRNLSHRTKEEKMGFWRGWGARMRMYWEIARFVSHTVSSKW